MCEICLHLNSAIGFWDLESSTFGYDIKHYHRIISKEMLQDLHIVVFLSVMRVLRFKESSSLFLLENQLFTKDLSAKSLWFQSVLITLVYLKQLEGDTSYDN